MLQPGTKIKDIENRLTGVVLFAFPYEEYEHYYLCRVDKAIKFVEPSDWITNFVVLHDSAIEELI